MENMQSFEELPDVSPLAIEDLPFGDRASDSGAANASAPSPGPAPPSIKPIRFKITLDRIIRYGETPGCPGCAPHPYDQYIAHNAECRARFSRLLEEDGILPKSLMTVEPISNSPGNFLAIQDGPPS